MPQNYPFVANIALATLCCEKMPVGGGPLSGAKFARKDCGEQMTPHVDEAENKEASLQERKKATLGETIGGGGES